MPSQELSTTYAGRERHNAQRCRQTDGRTDDSIMPVADHIALYDRLKWWYCYFINRTWNSTRLCRIVISFGRGQHLTLTINTTWVIASPRETKTELFILLYLF